MSKFVVVVFPDETKAYQGVQAMKALHAEGSITLYSNAVVQRSAEGAILVKDKEPDGAVATGAGVVVGTLIGMFAGPVGMAAGLTAGAVLGASRDLFDLGIGKEFVEKVYKDLAPGRTAVVAEIAEDWITALDSRMSQLEGVVTREWRDDFIDDVVLKRLQKAQANMKEREAELAAAAGEKAKALKNELSLAEQAVRNAVDNVAARMKMYREETEAKIHTLQEQQQKARADARKRIDERIAEIRADQKQRLGKLEEAWKLTQEALRP